MLSESDWEELEWKDQADLITCKSMGFSPLMQDSNGSLFSFLVVGSRSKVTIWKFTVTGGYFPGGFPFLKCFSDPIVTFSSELDSLNYASCISWHRKPDNTGVYSLAIGSVEGDTVLWKYNIQDGNFTQHTELSGSDYRCVSKIAWHPFRVRKLLVQTYVDQE